MQFDGGAKLCRRSSQFRAYYPRWRLYHFPNQSLASGETVLPRSGRALWLRQSPTRQPALFRGYICNLHYCDHCAGWIGPIIDKVGYHLVYDVIDRTKPQCVVKIFKDKEEALKEEKKVKLLMGWPGKKT